MMLQLHGSACANHGHGSLQATVLAVTSLVRALHLSLPPIASVASPIASPCQSQLSHKVSGKTRSAALLLLA